MNRRNFFKTATGFIAGVFAGTKSSEKDLCGGQNGTLCPRCKFNNKEPEPSLLETYNWIDMGCFKEILDVRELHCCYTRPGAGKIRAAMLCQVDEIELTKKVYEERRRAVEGGAWYPTNKTKYRIN